MGVIKLPRQENPDQDEVRIKREERGHMSITTPGQTDVGLMCLRNPDHVPTTYGSMREMPLTPEHRATLFQPRFMIRPDESHLELRDLPETEKPSLLNMQAMDQNPLKVAALFGSPDAPYLCIDPFYMTTEPDDTEAQSALPSLTQHIENSIKDLFLNPEEICFIDNYRAVHGRKPFTARYNGTDRWLKRILVTQDLRKSRAVRTSAVSRIIEG